MVDKKPCPFCGATMTKVMKKGSKRPNTHTVYMMCKKCHSRGPTSFFEEGSSPEEEEQAAISTWNSRKEI